MKKLILVLLLGGWPAYAEVLSNQAASSIVDYSFTSRTTTGAPTAIVGGAVACIKSNSATTSTAGVTFTANLGSVTALNHLRVDLSADTSFYSANADIACYFTAGTVGGTSISPEVIVQFGISSDFTIRKNVAFPNFPIWMLSASGAAVPAITPSCQIQKDSGAFTVPTSGPLSATEVANGKYLLNLSATDLNANAWSILCTGTGAVPYRRDVTPQQ